MRIYNYCEFTVDELDLKYLNTLNHVEYGIIKSIDKLSVGHYKIHTFLKNYGIADSINYEEYFYLEIDFLCLKLNWNGKLERQISTDYAFYDLKNSLFIDLINFQNSEDKLNYQFRSEQSMHNMVQFCLSLDIPEKIDLISFSLFLSSNIHFDITYNFILYLYDYKKYKSIEYLCKRNQKVLDVLIRNRLIDTVEFKF